MNKIIALVPMKGHSERVPNKNLKILAGKPLLFWILKTLSNSAYIAEIFVDTDSPLIKKSVKRYFKRKVKVIDRPKALYGDFISMNKIIEHDISLIEGEYFLQTHSTNPLLRTATVNKAIKKFFAIKQIGLDSLFAVNQIQSRLFDSYGKPLNHDPANLIRTQDLPPVYEENSNFYIFSRKSFTKTSSRIGRSPYFFVMPKSESVDIDNKIDFKIAGYIFKRRVND